MLEPETHYVLIVHGTWNSPEAGKTKWFQKGGAFANALSTRLEGTALAGAVWRRCGGKPTDFSWCGENTHEARLKAAEGLCEKMLAIRAAEETARIHVVAHSHGGNVVLKAVELYFSKLFRDAALFCHDPQLHRIGRIVFLGTPFLHKRWHRHRHKWISRGVRALRIIIDSTVGTTLVLLSWTIAGLFVGGVAYTPIYWPIWGQAAVLVLSIGFYSYFMRPVEQEQRDVNFYYTPLSHEAASFIARYTPIPVLIVTAAELDEALLGLSAEALFNAYLPPEIDKLTAPKLRWRLRERAGAAWGTGDLLLGPGVWLILVGTNGVKLMLRPVYAVTLRPLLRAYLRRSLRRLMLAQASGLPPHEFNAARLAVRPDIGVPEIFDDGLVWNVAELVAGAPSLLPAAVEKERYTFLWSPDALVERLPQSRIWPRLNTEEYWAMLKRERGYLPDYEELLALQRACLVTEEKARELGGAVQLAHSGYYGHPRIVDAIAAFLVTGQRPTDAEGQARGATSS